MHGSASPASATQWLLSSTPMSASQLIMLLLAVVGLSIVLISTRRRSIRSRQGSGTTVRDRYAALKRNTGARRDTEEVLIQLDKVAREVTARIDMRFSKLETVIRDADERIERLTRLLRVAEQRSLSIPGDDAESFTPPGSKSATETPKPETVHNLSDRGLSPQQIARKTGQTIGEVELILAMRQARSRIAPVAAHTAQPSDG